jgi:amino acid adenylation domain-containing protein/thioester reductase-like protein
VKNVSNQRPFSCYLVGEDSLLIQCAEILLARHHRILGVISPLDNIKEWALAYKIDCFESFAKAETSLANAGYDYLFSVVNSQILPQQLFDQCQEFAINFHDSPLPRLAGVHATSWAILTDEKEHAITWHVVNSMIDGGDILKQVTFEIENDETALSLNLKCYQHAIHAFSSLVDELATKTYQRLPQNFNQRTYYGFSKKPPANGWVSWEASAESIDRLCRASYLGQYTNRFSLVKFRINNEIFVIDQWQIGGESKKCPGTLVSLSSERLEIATATRNFIVLRMSTLEGKPCNFKHIKIQHRLLKNYLFPSASQWLLDQFGKISEMLFKHEKFWVDQLIHFKPATLPFLTDNLLSHHYSQHCISSYFLTESLIEKLNNAYPHVPLVTIILTAWLVYLYRLGNQESLGIGLGEYPDLNSIPPEVSCFFSIELPFCVSLEKNMDFFESIQVVEEKLQLLKLHVAYERSLTHRYPVLSNDSKFFPLAVFITDELEIAAQRSEKISLVTFIISKDGKRLSWFGNTHSLKCEPNFSILINGFPNHLSTLLESITQETSLKISEFNLLPIEEKQKTLLKWNQTKIDYPKNQSLASLYEYQANLAPNHIALVDENEQLSYLEVNQRTNQLAHFLEKNGLTSGAGVGICNSHDLQTMISILAIIKIGAIYVPIDFNAPAAHIQSILESSKLRFIITKKRYTANIKQAISRNVDCQILEIKKYQKIIQMESKSNLNKDISTEALASIIYTSGTTGKPKGVMITHKGIIRLVKHTNYISISSNDRVAQAASISFDAATFEIWGALLNGASLVCVTKDTLLNAVEFSNFLKNQSISILWLTSALFDQYALADPSMFKDLHYLLVGGDVLNRETIKLVLECRDGRPRHILNGYGPTENTTFTTTHQISKKSVMRPRIPIGKPITNTQVYVLDDYLNPMPIGVPGEMYIAGDGLSKGYINNPELTKEKFIPNFFDRCAEAKLYKTGDIVCWLPDGSLDYMGRKDKQVKIRGFRVELEAIQSHLLQYESINQCFVAIYEDGKLGKFLVAYIVFEECSKPTLVNLKKFLRNRLPDYMIPTDFIALEKFPLTQNGKINYKALPLPSIRKKQTEAAYIDPKSVTEKKLAQLWCDLFAIDKVSTEDDFFALGGHSLLLTKFVLDLRDCFGFELSLHVFLKNPTLKYLAKLIDNNANAAQVFSPSISLNDLQLDFFIQKKELHYTPTPINAILLTGATGFLGIHLLSNLCKASQAKLYCLVRAASKKEAKEKLESSIDKYHLSSEIKKRIVPIVGDLEKPYLGLLKHQFSYLAKKIDAIYHNAAYVHHLYSYKMLRSANVLGTIELLKLATLFKVKPFYYVSSLSAAGGETNVEGLVSETLISHMCIPQVIRDGYSQTKWVSESLVAQASRQGVPVKVYRPGWILGESNTGEVAAENNHLLLLIKGCIQMGVAPDWEVRLNILPVDFVSRLIIESSCDQKIHENVFNFGNKNTITWIELINYIHDKHYPIEIIPADLWKNKYLRKIDNKNAIFNLLTIYTACEFDWVKNLDSTCNVNDSNTRKALRKLCFNYPDVDNRLLDNYFTYLIKEAFLPDPLF